MKILVGISKSPDTTSKIAFTDNNTAFDQTGVQYIVNVYDEWYALVRALELKETLGGTVTIVMVGTSADDAIIRKALALGADEAVRIDTQPKDAFSTASQIANYAKDKSFDLILFGKETIQYNGSQVGGMVAELLDYPFVSLASKLEIDGSTVKLDKEYLGGIQSVEVSTPVVVSCSKGMAQQRIPNMRGIMAARTKPLSVITPIETQDYTTFVSYTTPPAKSSVKLIDPNNVEELVNLLHNEAKVI